MAENRVCSLCEKSTISGESSDPNDLIPCSTCGDFCKCAFADSLICKQNS